MGVTGNIGAIPVFDSVASIPTALRWPGMVFAVPRGGDGWVEFFAAVSPASPPGLGYEPAAPAPAPPSNSGGSIVGTLVGVGVSLLPLLMQQTARAGDERAAADAFEQRAARVTAVFNDIQAQDVITAADVLRAEQELTGLATMAAQAASIAYIARQWSSPAYQPAYEARLQQIRQAAAAGGGTSPGGVTPPAGSSSSPVLVVALVVTAVLLIGG